MAQTQVARFSYYPEVSDTSYGPTPVGQLGENAAVAGPSADLHDALQVSAGEYQPSPGLSTTVGQLGTNAAAPGFSDVPPPKEGQLGNKSATLHQGLPWTASNIDTG